MTGIRVEGLRRLDAMALKKKFPDASIEFVDADIEDPSHGELATAAVVAISIAGLQVLATWLLKNRKGSVIEKTIEIVNPDGSTRKETIKIDISESSAPEADVIESLAKISNVDLGTFIPK